jgi:DNA-binding GntR family transcriptional regulator
MIATTSKENYRQHRYSGKLGEQAKAIFDFVKKLAPGEDISRMELADVMDMRLSSVCGRVNELVSAGLLEPTVNRKCRVSGMTICPVRAVAEAVGDLNERHY